MVNFYFHLNRKCALKKYLFYFVLILFLPGFMKAQTANPAQDTVTTPSGLKYIVLEKGTGEQAVAGKEVAVNYIGKLANGTVFDDSYKRGKPIKFVLGEGKVIKGWDEGIALMHVGDKFRLIIPPQLGYGANGAGGVIPPNATLIFDTQLMSVSVPKLSLADTLMATIFEKGIDSAVAQYHELYKTEKDKYDFDEDQINGLAFRFMRNGMFEPAIALLKLNAETYPKSEDIYEALGDAYMFQNNKILAVENFYKVLQLDPKNEHAQEMIKKLQGK